MVSLAVPLKDGVVSLEGDGGWLNVTVGGAVLTVKVTSALLPTSEARFACVACAV